MTLSLSGGPKGAGAQDRGDGVQGQSLGEGSGALPLLGLGGMGAGVPLVKWGAGCHAQGWPDHTKSSPEGLESSLQNTVWQKCAKSSNSNKVCPPQIAGEIWKGICYQKSGHRLDVKYLGWRPPGTL